MNRRRFLSDAAKVSLTVGGAMLTDRTLAAPPNQGDMAGEKPAGRSGLTRKYEPFPNLEAAREWFSDTLFNLLVDYYPETPSRPYGTGATPENVLPVLKDLQLGYIIIYAKGHSGRTSFRSSLKTEHEMLGADQPALFRKYSRETGTRLFLYYSGLVDGFAAERHPDWRLLNTKGEANRIFTDFMYGRVSAYMICPQSPYFDEWVAVHFREMFSEGDPDGVWVDGDWVGPCYCHRCLGRYRRETGFQGNLPEGPEWDRYWATVKLEWATKLNKLVKSLKPTCLYSSGNVTPRNEFSVNSDWLSGDWFSPDNHRLQQSIAMRHYTTSGKSYDAMTCDTQFMHALLNTRARTKTLARMVQEGAGVLANGGQWCYWTYPMPDGALVPSKMRIARKAAEFARQRKEVCLHNQSVPWTAVLDAEPKSSLWGANVWGAGKALIELHRSPVVMDETNLNANMEYDLIVVPEQPVLTSDTIDRLKAFVHRGGKLLSTGVSVTSPEMQNLLGVKLVGQGVVEEAHVFRKDNNPTGVYAPWDKLELQTAGELYPAYLSWDHANEEMKKMPPNYPINGMVDEENPEKAGFPAATVRRLGKGVAVHIPTEIFRVYWTFGYPDVLAWLGEVLHFLDPTPLFRTDALSFVEVALRQKDDTLLVHFINGNSGRDLSYVRTNDLWVDDIPPVGPLTCLIRCSDKPGSASWEPGGEPAGAIWSDGMLKVVLPRLEIHTCLKVPGWKRPTVA
jgi:hypothetical protein